MELYLFSNIPAVVQSLQKYCFRSETSKIIHFSAFDTKLLTPEVLIILEPFRIKNIYVTISPIWKQYLILHSRETKLVVMGFCEFQSTNYIDILNFPMPIDSFLENVLPVSANWELPIDGANMLDRIDGFFEGHGGVSVISKLNELCQTLQIAYTNLKDGSNSFEELKKDLLLPFAVSEWQEVIARWQYSLPLFEYLPFYPTIQEINEIFSDLSENFACFFPQEDLFLATMMDVKLKQVHQKLLEIDRLYIRNSL